MPSCCDTPFVIDARVVDFMRREEPLVWYSIGVVCDK